MPGAGFVSVPFESALTDKLEILTQSGSPQFFGVIAESSVPGLVLDAVGIDGARVATALAWNEASFEAAVRARAPSLVVMAFGTNEAFDADKVEKYRAQYEALLARSRAAAPNADCLLVGPPDGNAVAGGSEPRLVEIDALERSVAAQLGCGYVGQMDIMGGPGSYSRWAHQSPPLARGDRLHLSAKGYEVVADAIAVQLLSAYARDAH
jgi:lysophospholipase L1-like esterase